MYIRLYEDEELTIDRDNDQLRISIFKDMHFVDEIFVSLKREEEEEE